MVPEQLRRYYFSPSPRLVSRPGPLRFRSSSLPGVTTRNNQPISVNGLSANTGASIVTGATIETGADQSATVNLGSLGTLDIAPNTKLVLTYDDQGNVKALIVYGCAILTAKKKTKVRSLPSRALLARLIRLRVVCWTFASHKARRRRKWSGRCGAAGGAGAATATAAAGGGGLFGLGRAATVAIIAGFIGEVALVPLVFQDNPSGLSRKQIA